MSTTKKFITEGEYNKVKNLPQNWDKHFEQWGDKEDKIVEVKLFDAQEIIDCVINEQEKWKVIKNGI